MDKNNEVHKKPSWPRKLLDLFLHEHSLSKIDVTSFINILYPIALSLILAFLIHKRDEIFQSDNAVVFACKIFIIFLLTIYVLLDWDDCHHAAGNKEQNTAYERVLWLMAIFWLSLIPIMLLSSSDINQLEKALILWLLYLIITSLVRDWMIERETRYRGKVIVEKLPNTEEYKPYRESMIWSVVMYSAILVGLLASRYEPFADWVADKMTWEPNPKTAQAILSLVYNSMFILFLAVVFLAVWLKNRRKKILFLESKKVVQIEEGTT